MGWYGEHKPKSISTIDYLKQGWEGHKEIEILDSAMRGFNSVFFLAKHKELGYTFVIVYLVSYSNTYHNICYKSMDEFAGPNVLCPKKFLNKLTPVEEIARLDGREIEYPKEGEKFGGNGYYWAMDWRKKSAEQFKEKAVRAGDIVKTDEPLNFSGGHKFQYFKKVGRSIYAVKNDFGFPVICKVQVNLKKYNLEFIKRRNPTK